MYVHVHSFDTHTYYIETFNIDICIGGIVLVKRTAYQKSRVTFSINGQKVYLEEKRKRI